MAAAGDVPSATEPDRGARARGRRTWGMPLDRLLSVASAPRTANPLGFSAPFAARPRPIVDAHKVGWKREKRKETEVASAAHGLGRKKGRVRQGVPF